jgi:hypothetical protein
MHTHRLAWRHWYHLTLGTYGRWLPGDQKSWRERHHRKHVPTNPSQKFQHGLHAYAQSLLKRPSVSFLNADFPRIGQHLLASLRIQCVTSLAIAVASQHCHLLVQCTDDDPRRCAANLKSHIYHHLFTGQPSPWEKRSHEVPAHDETHARQIFRYILDHEKQGAWVWNFRMGQ